jgi:hypothetical protein
MAVVSQMIEEHSHNAGKRYDFTGWIGYTRPPPEGSLLQMDDLASDHPQFREIRTVKISDVRGSESKFTLEKHGFQYLKLPDIPGEGVVDFYNEEDPNILRIYYPGMASWFAERYSTTQALGCCSD